ncbi:MAG TPA: SRPBCC family protein [Gemmatimonadota bacterium]|nr:SRPBCC family protein [Gemmatimonadota bacterium]
MRSSETLVVTTPTDREIRMTRVFDAPRSLVFDAMTKPELLRRWFFGPDGWSLAVCEIDPKVGGKYRYVWRRDSDGTEMGMSGVILEIVPPERFVGTERFDESWYPGEAVGTIVLIEKDGRTTLTNTIRYESKEARDAVLRSPAKDGMEVGYDRLASVLASLQAGRSSHDEN